MNKQSRTAAVRSQSAESSRVQRPHPAFPRALSLASQVADFIVDGIAGGNFEFGQRLIETDLAAQLGVSRVPIREAVKMLDAQGILMVTPHRGAHVAEFNDIKIDRIREARVALERLALPDALATFQAHPEKQLALAALVARMEDAVARRDWIEAGKADLEFHRQICQASDNEIVITLWEALARHIAIVFGRELRAEGGNPRLAEQHERILRLIRKGALDLLDQELRKHIMRLRRAGAERRTGRVAPTAKVPVLRT
jgi:DNA-binding GntR family transcriptional regulator